MVHRQDVPGAEVEVAAPEDVAEELPPARLLVRVAVEVPDGVAADDLADELAGFPGAARHAESVPVPQRATRLFVHLDQAQRKDAGDEEGDEADGALAVLVVDWQERERERERDCSKSNFLGEGCYTTYVQYYYTYYKKRI